MGAREEEGRSKGHMQQKRPDPKCSLILDNMTKGQTSSDPQNPEKDPGYRNVLKLIILIVVLVGAWYLLDWLINGK
jgi:hypothetical protein